MFFSTKVKEWYRKSLRYLPLIRAGLTAYEQPTLPNLKGLITEGIKINLKVPPKSFQQLEQEALD